MTAEEILCLKKYGFEPFYDGSDIMAAFKHPIYGLDAKMYTRGEHSDERAVIMYVQNDDFEGLCYANSLIEYLMVSYPDDHGMDEIIKELASVGIFVELKFIRIYPMIVMSRENIESPSDDIMFEFYLSDMIKASAILDYLVQKRLSYLRGKHNG